MMTHWWRELCGEEGSALVEMAFVLPLVMVMVAGVTDIGLYEERKMQVVESANAAAGFGAQGGNQNNTAGMQAAGISASPSLTGLVVNASVLWTCTPGGAAVTSAADCGGGINPLQYVQVATSAPVNAPMPLGVFGSSITVRGRATYRVRWKPS